MQVGNYRADIEKQYEIQNAKKTLKTKQMNSAHHRVNNTSQLDYLVVQ
jgi:hypothetical protein